jgi:hypothetical protein
MSLRQHEIGSIIKWSGLDLNKLEDGGTVKVTYSDMLRAIRYAYDIGVSDANNGAEPPMIPEGSTRCAPENFKA